MFLFKIQSCSQKCKNTQVRMNCVAAVHACLRACVLGSLRSMLQAQVVSCKIAEDAEVQRKSHKKHTDCAHPAQSTSIYEPVSMRATPNVSMCGGDCSDVHSTCSLCVQKQCNSVRKCFCCPPSISTHDQHVEHLKIVYQFLT